jgi:hypothetical protein
LSGLRASNALTYRVVELGHDDLDPPSVDCRSKPTPTRKESGDLGIGERQYQPRRRLFLVRDGYELQCVASDLVSLTTLQLALMGKDLDENRLVGRDPVDIYHCTITSVSRLGLSGTPTDFATASRISRSASRWVGESLPNSMA